MTLNGHRSLVKVVHYFTHNTYGSRGTAHAYCQFCIILDWNRPLSRKRYEIGS